MKTYTLIINFVLFLLFLTFSVQGQRTRINKNEKLDQELLCPFENGIQIKPKEPFSWDIAYKKTVFVSQTDTAIRSCANAKVASINTTEDGRYEMVLYYRDFYFWYEGLGKPSVHVKQDVKAGEIIGTYHAGQQIEIRMYRDEEAMDLTELIKCKKTDEKKVN